MILKNQTVRREYHITIADAAGKTVSTVQVRAEGVRDALKKAYEKVSGWQKTEVEVLD